VIVGLFVLLVAKFFEKFEARWSNR